MNIILIYKNYGIPEPLQRHMLRVAGIAEQILANWVGPEINRKSLIKVLLLHDMGNLVKMEPEPDESTITKTTREKFIKKFGKDDHAVSREIAFSLGLSKAEVSLMDNKIFIKNDETVNSNDFARKIGAYADQRTAPEGILPILERLKEAQHRYKDKPGSSMNNPKTEMLINCAVELEKQIMKNCKLSSADEINDNSVMSYIEQLKHFNLDVT
jgi:hypothetical protein